MTKRRRISSRQGFSLTEIMIAVAIIGILASIAIPRYQLFEARGKRTEAYSILGAIRQNEISYFFETDTFSSNPPLNTLVNKAVIGAPKYFWAAQYEAPMPRQAFAVLLLGDLDKDSFLDGWALLVGHVTATTVPITYAAGCTREGMYIFRDDVSNTVTPCH